MVEGGIAQLGPDFLKKVDEILAWLGLEWAGLAWLAPNGSEFFSFLGKQNKSKLSI